MENIRRFKYNGEDSLVLPAQAEAFTTLSLWIEGIADELAVPFKTKNQLLIAVDEIFTNIASYGYPTSNGSATVVVEFDMVKEILEHKRMVALGVIGRQTNIFVHVKRHNIAE